MSRFADGAREAGRTAGVMPKVLQLHLSWAPTDEVATRTRSGVAERRAAHPRGDIRSPFEFDQLARMVRPEDFAGRMLVSADADAHRADIQRHLDLGFDPMHLHNVGRDQAEFLEVFGRDVLPGLRG